MDYYDKLIHRALEALDGACETAIDPGEVLSWKQTDGNPLVLESESALELGRYPLPGVEFTMMSGSGLVDRDLIRIFGPDITDKRNLTAHLEKSFFWASVRWRRGTVSTIRSRRSNI